MNILITGINGSLGQEIAKKVLEKNTNFLLLLERIKLIKLIMIMNKSLQWLVIARKI